MLESSSNESNARSEMIMRNCLNCLVSVLTTVADVLAVTVAVAVAAVALATAAAAEEAPAMDADAVPTADTAIDCTTTALKWKRIVEMFK